MTFKFPLSSVLSISELELSAAAETFGAKQIAVKIIEKIVNEWANLLYIELIIEVRSLV